MEASPSILPGRSIYPSRSIELEIVVKLAGATVLPQFGGSTGRGCRSMRAGSPAARSMHRAARPQRQLQCEKQTRCPPRTASSSIRRRQIDRLRAATQPAATTHAANLSLHSADRWQASICYIDPSITHINVAVVVSGSIDV